MMDTDSGWRRALARWSVVPFAVGAVLSTGTLGTVTAHASAPQALQRATYIGTSTLAGQGSAGFVDTIHDATRGDAANAKAFHGALPNAVPNPPAQGITTKGKFTGFNGLNHVDQRLAGTGKYTNTQFSLEPPDQGLCVGGGFVLESVNTAFRVFDAHGNPLSAPEAFNQFFGVPPEVIRSHPPVFGDFLSDPKCNYDAATRRWFMTILQVDAPGNFFVSRAHVFVAVSQGANPLGGWNLFSIDATDDGTQGTPNDNTPLVTCPCLPDQPLLGLNADAVVISTNEYGTPTAANTNPNNPEIGGQIYAISKEALEHASSGNLPQVVHLNPGQLPMPNNDCCVPWDSIQPAASPTGDSQSAGVEYFLSSFTNNTTVNHAINVWAMTGTDTLERNHPDVDLQRVQLHSVAYSDQLPVSSPGLGGIAVDQKEGPRPLGTTVGLPGPPAPLPQLNANDVRMNQVVYAAGKLWGGVNTAVQGGARSAIAYFVVEPSLEDGHLSAEMRHQGYVSVAGESVLFPSIGVNQDGNGAIAFSVTGPDIFPSAAYIRIKSSGRLSGDVVISGPGAAPDDGFTGYTALNGGAPPVGRWGDYSAAVAAADGSIWMAAEYIPNAPRTVLANWGTFVTHIKAPASNEGDNGGGGGQ